MQKLSTPEVSADPALLFNFFNEVGIIAQLSRALLEARLEDGLTVHHFGVLQHLIKRGDGKTPMDLARAFQVPKTSMSHTLAGLEKRGLIDVRANPEDGRGKLIFITRKGRATRDQAIKAMEPDVARLMPKLTAEKMLTLLPLMQEVRQILDEARN